MDTPESKNTEKLAALGRMTRGIVHDFNNSLASVLGYTEFLLTDLPPDGEPHIFATNIRKAGLQMQDLIAQVRALAVERGQGKDATVSLTDELKILAEGLSAHLPHRQSLVFDADIESATLSLPLLQFRTLFSNLIRNAVESLEDKDGRVTVRIRDARTFRPALDAYHDIITPLSPMGFDRPTVRVDIIDTGCGMSETVLNLALEPHFTTKSGGEHYGMGLPVAYGIVNYLDGGLVLASTPQGGTMISVLLPVDSLSLHKTTETEAGPSYRILIVEDGDLLRETLVTMLERMGHRTSAFDNPEDALDTFRESPRNYDFLITDYTMPDMSGADLAREIHADFPNFPVVLLSGDGESLTTLAPNGTSLHSLAKPVTGDALRRLIDRLKAG